MALTVASQATGDIIYASSSSAWARLGVGSNGQFLKLASGLPSWAGLPTGTTVQMVKSLNVTKTSGSTALPVDDTIPQITEGITCGIDTAITPASTSNRLVIQVLVCYATGTGQNTTQGLALFQDSTAGALAATTMTAVNNDNAVHVVLTHEMAAGTTSATTFRARIGDTAGSTITINGQNNARIFGGVLQTSMVIWEISA